MAPLINPNINADGVISRLRTETNPKFRRMLEEVRYHNQVEAVGELEPVIERMSPDCVYHLYEAGQETVSIAGKDAVRRDFYENLMKVINPLLEWDAFRVFVDDAGVVTEGRLKAAVRGSYLIEQGYEADPDGFYLRRAQHLVIWPFDDKLRSTGEIIYYGPAEDWETVLTQKLKPEDIGPYEGSFDVPTSEVPGITC